MEGSFRQVLPALTCGCAACKGNQSPRDSGRNPGAIRLRGFLCHGGSFPEFAKSGVSLGQARMGRPRRRRIQATGSSADDPGSR